MNRYLPFQHEAVVEQQLEQFGLVVVGDHGLIHRARPSLLLLILLQHHRGIILRLFLDKLALFQLNYFPKSTFIMLFTSCVFSRDD